MNDAAERLKWWAKDHENEGMATAEVKVADLQTVLRERDEARAERDAAIDAPRRVREWLEPGVSDTSEHDTYGAIDDSVSHINSVLSDLGVGRERR